MLSYHPAYDILHCVMRQMDIINYSENEYIESEKIHILDFYYLFPTFLEDMRLPSKYIKNKKRLAEKQNPYFDPIDKISGFRILSPIQHNSLRTLAAKRLIESESLRKGWAVKTDFFNNAYVEFRLRRTEKDMELLQFLVREVGEITLYGKNGLKARSGLLEYRYDTN